MDPRVKIAPQITVPVARRLRLVASSMSAVVNEMLDGALPSLDEIRSQLAIPEAGERSSDACGH